MSDSAAKNRPSEVIYQIYPASFQDSNGDGHGDLKGITQKLDYIKSLNVDAIWLSPYFLSPEGAAGDGGYAITDYRKIGKQFGTMNDFEHLLSEAHKRGLKVYTDFVLCHTSDEHEWFKKSQKREPGFEDRYVWHDGKRDEQGQLIKVDGKPVPPNNWQSVFKDSCAWKFDEDRQQFFLHHFNGSQPSLNLNEAHVQEASLKEMKFWLDKGVDGLRLDALPFANYDPNFRDNPYKGDWQGGWESHYFAPDFGQMCQDSTIDFVKKIRGMLDTYQPPRIALGEVVAGRMGGGDSMEMAAEYLHPKDGGKGLNTCYTQSLVQFWNEYPPPDRLRDMIRKNVALSPDGGFCNNLGNHDFPRFPTRMMNGDPPYELREKIVKQLMTLSVALPGSFCMYNGEELGLTQAKLGDDIPHEKMRDLVAKDCRDPCRTPMPWQADGVNAGFSPSSDPYLPIPRSHLPLAVDLQEKQPDSMLNFTRRIIHQRRENIALSQGKTTVLDTASPIVAFVRQTGEQAVLCAFNMSDRAVSFRPSNFIDEETRKKIKLVKGGEVHMDAFGYSFHGLQLPTKGVELGMAPSPPELHHLELHPHHDSGKRSVFAADMLIADSHVNDNQVPATMQAFRAKDLSFTLGEKSTIDADLHSRFIEETRRNGGSQAVTAGGSTCCTLRTLKELLKDEVDINLMGLAADDNFGRTIKKFLTDSKINMVTPTWPADTKQVTAVSHIVKHGKGNASILTHPGTEIDALHKILEQQPELLESSVRKSDIVYLPESTVSKFGIPFFHKLLDARWRNKKELVLALPTRANFGPDDSERFKFLIPSCNVVMGNDVEFARILDTETTRPVGEEQMKRVTDKIQAMFAERLLEKHGMPCSPYGQVALITRGEKPALLVTEDGVEPIPAAEVQGAGNRLGAGYAAFAGFLTGYIKGLDHGQSAALAMALAVEKIQQDNPNPFIDNPTASMGTALKRRSMAGVASALDDANSAQGAGNQGAENRGAGNGNAGAPARGGRRWP